MFSNFINKRNKFIKNLHTFALIIRNNIPTMINFFKSSQKLVLILIVIHSFVFNLNSQNNNNYSLLWKIEGGEFKDPSYLFGTMHVDDERAFNFSDAVLPAIENCEKFALEVHSDSIITKMYTKLVNKDAYLTFKKILNEKEFKKLSDRFFEINGYKIEDSSIGDPNLLISLLEPSMDKESDKSLFVDLHLLQHAKTMQRHIIGLEDIDSQLNYFELLSPEKQKEFLLKTIKYNTKTFKKQYEEMVEIYLTGDLKKIDDRIKSFNGYDFEMEQRNEVMCQSIIRESENSSVFSAVGAAHLTGDKGLIQMFKDKGYKVTPARADFTGVADNYKIDIDKMKWYKHKNQDLGYSVETPGILSIDSSNIYKIHNNLDYRTNKSYSFFALDLRINEKENDKEEIFNRVITKAKEKYDFDETNKKKITIDGASGYEVTMKNKENEIEAGNTFTKIAILINKNIFYQFFAIGNSDQIEEKSTTRFFNSIQFTEPKPRKKTSNEWVDYYNEEGAFSIKLPNNPKDSSREVDSQIDGVPQKFFLNMYISTDFENNDNYIVRFNDQPLGYRVENLEESFKSVESTFLNRAEILSPPKVIHKNGYEGREYEILLEKKSHAIIKLFFRGNRVYLLLSQKLIEGEKTDPNNRFFNGFEFEEYKTEPLTEIKNKKFKFKVFENKIVNSDSIGDYSEANIFNSVDYYSKNDQNGNMYSFGYSKIKPYFKIDSIKSYYNETKSNLKNWNDSIISEKFIKIDNNVALDFSIISKEDSIQSRHLLWLDGDYFFLSSAYASKESINNTISEEILNSYKALKNKQSIDYFSSKTDIILSDLKSKDSTVFNNAIGSFSYYNFENKDLDKLYKAVKTKYASKENKEAVIESIISTLNTVNNKKTLQFLEQTYRLQDVSEDIKRDILVLIPKLENDNSLDIYANILLNNPPKDDGKYHYQLFSPLKDSTEFALKNYNGLINLKDSKKYREEILDISTKILKSDNENRYDILPKFKELTNSSFLDLDQYIKMLAEEDYDYSKHALIYSYLEYFHNLPKKTHQEVIDPFTQELLDANANSWMTLEAAETRVKHELKLPKTIKKSLLDSLSTRFYIIKAYHTANKLNEVPNKFIDQKSFSELSLAQFLEDNSEYPDKRELLGKIEYKSKNYDVYKITYGNDDDSTNNESFLILVEPSFIVSQVEEFKIFPAFTDWNLLEKDWKTHAKQIILEEFKSQTD